MVKSWRMSSEVSTMAMFSPASTRISSGSNSNEVAVTSMRRASSATSLDSSWPSPMSPSSIIPSSSIGSVMSAPPSTLGSSSEPQAANSRPRASRTAMSAEKRFMGFFLRGFEDDRSTTPCRSTRRSARCAVDLCGHVREIRRRHLDDRVDGGGCDTGRERPGMPAAESVGVRDDGQRRQRHGSGGDDRAQTDAEERIQHARSDGDADGVVDEGKEQVLAEVAHRGAGSEEDTTELESIMRISYAVFCSK